MVDNKQLKSFAPTVHCTLPFCIALCSMHLISLALLNMILHWNVITTESVENLSIRGDKEY